MKLPLLSWTSHPYNDPSWPTIGAIKTIFNQWIKPKESVFVLGGSQAVVLSIPSVRDGEPSVVKLGFLSPCIEAFVESWAVANSKEGLAQIEGFTRYVGNMKQ